MPTIWTAGYNIPGYSPEGTVVAFETRTEALIFVVEALRGVAYQRSMGGHSSETGFAAEYERAADSLEGQEAGANDDWSDTFEDGRVAFWFLSSNLAADEAAEVLEEAAETLERDQ